jgi:hypothetical protein
MISKNIVILANQWNPTIFTADWLNSRTGVNDFCSEIVVPPLAIAKSPAFNLVCQPEMLQLVQNDPEQPAKKLVTLALDIATKLPETRFTALGLNFLDKFSMESSETQKMWIARFVDVKEIPGFCTAKETDLAITAHLSKDFDDYRLTLKLQAADEQGTPCVVVDFNYHFQVKNFEEVKTALGMHQASLERTTKILEQMRHGTN